MAAAEPSVAPFAQADHDTSGALIGHSSRP